MELSIVIPFYNEENRVEPGLSQSLEYLQQKLKSQFELIFVNDGSTDSTLAILENVKNAHPGMNIKIISYGQNMGKGHAVKMGVLSSEGRKIVVTDADFSVSLNEINRFIEKLDEFDLVVGTKKHLQTQTLRKQKVPRRILGKGFTLLTNLVMGLNFTDITCGFKSFRAEAAKKIFSKQVMDRWSYDAETLFLAKRFNYKVMELPVTWYHIEGSKVSPLKDTFKSLKDLFSIIYNYRRGKYN